MARPRAHGRTLCRSELRKPSAASTTSPNGQRGRHSGRRATIACSLTLPSSGACHARATSGSRPVNLGQDATPRTPAPRPRRLRVVEQQEEEEDVRPGVFRRCTSMVMRNVYESTRPTAVASRRQSIEQQVEHAGEPAVQRADRGVEVEDDVHRHRVRPHRRRGRRQRTSRRWGRRAARVDEDEVGVEQTAVGAGGTQSECTASVHEDATVPDCGWSLFLFGPHPKQPLRAHLRVMASSVRTRRSDSEGRPALRLGNVLGPRALEPAKGAQ